MTPIFVFALVVALPAAVVTVVYGAAVLLGVAPDFALIMLTVPLMVLLLYALSSIETEVEREGRSPPSMWARLSNVMRDRETEPEWQPSMGHEERQRVARELLVFTVATLGWTWAVIVGV